MNVVFYNSEFTAFDLEKHILLLVGTDRRLSTAEQELRLRQVCGDWECPVGNWHFKRRRNMRH